MKVDLTNIKNLNINNAIRILEIESSIKDKSKKCIPVFNNAKKEQFFKAESKTKPYCSPLFSIAEVFWLHVIRNFFDNASPQACLAYCKGMEEYSPKYHNSVIQENENLINLYEYFKQTNELSHVKKCFEFIENVVVVSTSNAMSFNNYLNYCEAIYDYSIFFDTSLFKKMNF